VLDLFCGAAGGWSLGMHRAGYATIAACEIDPWRRERFLRNFPDVRMYEDVRDLTAGRLRADGAFPDIIVGSPPCQDASTANTAGRGLDGERTGLFFEAVRLVGECRPRWAAFENVPGIHHRGIDRVLDALAALGYACWPLVVGAMDIGAPHPRRRLWLVCADGGTIERLATQHTDRPPGGTLESVRGRASPQSAGIAAHADGEGQYGLARHGEMAGRLCEPAADADQLRCGQGAEIWKGRSEDVRLPGAAAGDAHGAGLEERQGERGDPCKEQPAALRAIGAAWPSWNGGASRFGGMDDGLPKGVARAALAAYGDAVVPQIAEMIGRAMRL
jgi:DNA (cytosine-5)-methyltransferase 1